jgi:hypothetical protein
VRRGEGKRYLSGVFFLRGAERTTPSFFLRIGSNSFTTYKGTFFFSFPGFLASGSDTVTILGFFFFVTRHANRAFTTTSFSVLSLGLDGLELRSF